MNWLLGQVLYLETLLKFFSTVSFFPLETGRQGRIKVQSSSSALDSIFSSSGTVGVHLIRVEGNVTEERQSSKMGWAWSGFWDGGVAWWVCYWVGVVYVQICSVGVVCVMRQGGRVHRLRWVWVWILNITHPHHSCCVYLWRLCSFPCAFVRHCSSPAACADGLRS